MRETCPDCKGSGKCDCGQCPNGVCAVCEGSGEFDWILVAARTLPATTTAQITPDGQMERDRKDAGRYRFIRAETVLLSEAIEKWDGIGMCPVGTIGAWLDATTVEKCDQEIDKAIELSAVRTSVASPDTRMNPDFPVKSLGDS